MTQRRVTLWFFEERLHGEHKQTLLARYRIARQGRLPPLSRRAFGLLGAVLTVAALLLLLFP